MAHKDSVINPQIREVLLGAGHFWNLSNSVGYGCKNRRADVMLVQFCINHSYTPYTEIVKVDGYFGGKTWNAIRNFQRDYSCVVDGAVRPADGIRHSTPIQNKIYTIYQLNSMLAQCLSQEQFRDLRRLGYLPELLKEELESVPVS